MSTYHCQLLDGGPLLLDGGSMFGVVPRVVWSRTVTPDDANRIALRHNCLLLTGVENDPELGRPRRVVIETGTGDKLDEKMTKIFGLDPALTVHAAVEGAGVDPAEIDDVIVSHLHFDHAGGLTRRCTPSESPDMTLTERDASGDATEVRLTFPNARVHTQRREWADAIANDAVMTKTYYRDHLLPLKLPLADGSPRLRLADCPPPFGPGLTPHRDQLPRTSVTARTTEILPGIGVFLVPGHTWGQQAVTFTDANGRTVVFTPDVLPSVNHLGQAYSLAYDVEPYTSMLSKRWLLTEAAERGWTLAIDHEPQTPMVSVAANDRGWFDLTPA